ncbi:MAG: type II secretion system protein [Armatimonadota bacterium]|nr:type II secretion system protein [Armatimonadota bacterium]
MKRFLKSNKGFTLLEILIVIALTVIVLGLVFIPVTRTFEFTRQAEVMVRTQDNARIAMEQISRDLADAMYVFDNTRDPINFKVKDATGKTVFVPVYYAKIDLVLPRMRCYCTSPKHPNNQPRDFPRHDPSNPDFDESAPRCKYDGSLLEIRPAEPLAPDTFIVRYFIGLRDPTAEYSNSYASKTAAPGTDNMFVLYRAEFSLYDDNLFDPSIPVEDRLSYPNFFYDEPYCRRWKQISRPMVTVENTDLVNIRFEGVNPIVMPTVKFMPTAVYNDPMVPTMEKSDAPEFGDAPPTVYKATYGHWVLPYEVMLLRKDPKNPGSHILYKTAQGTDGNGNPFIGIFRDGKLIFNITKYLATKSTSKYGAGVIEPAKPEVAFTIDPVKGTANFAFPVVNDQISSKAGGTMAISKMGSTDDINAAYISSGYRDRYRRFLINDPTDTSDPVSEILLNARVVPMSERVVAPCATPGPNYGKPILYSRTPLYCYEPDYNQYKLDIDYGIGSNGTPCEGVAAIFFHSLQTQERGSGVPLPPGKDNVFVFYQVQNNLADDTLRANYVTKSLITVTLGIKMYDPASGKPQNIELTNKVRIRNVAS